MYEWYEAEIAALTDQWRRRQITADEFESSLRDLKAAAKEQEERDAIILAGRGHLLK